MALFSRTKKEAKPKKAEAVSAAPQPVSARADYMHVLRSPRITEKASMAGSGVYVFDIEPGVNKKLVAAAVNAIYSVKPRRIAIVNIKSKNVRNMRTGKRGVTGGGKKAYVYLQKGETIAIT
jgi:ribosomal protein L23